MGTMALQLPSNEVTGDNPARTPIHHHDVHHLAARINGHRPLSHLPVKRTIRPEQTLLPRNPLRIKGSRNLHTTKRTVLDESTVIARKGYSHCRKVVDHVVTHLRSAVNIRLARTEVAPLEHIVKETIHAVVIVLIVLCRIRPPLRCYRMRPSRGILKTKYLDVVPQLPKCRSSR